MRKPYCLARDGICDERAGRPSHHTLALFCWVGDEYAWFYRWSTFIWRVGYDQGERFCRYIGWEGQGIFHFISFFFSSFVPEGKTNFINGWTGMVVDPSGPLMSKNNSVWDKCLAGGEWASCLGTMTLQL